MERGEKSLSYPHKGKVRLSGEVITSFKFLRGHNDVRVNQFFKIKRNITTGGLTASWAGGEPRRA